jgi:hypothetical protein
MEILVGQELLDQINAYTDENVYFDSINVDEERKEFSAYYVVRATENERELAGSFGLVNYLESIPDYFLCDYGFIVLEFGVDAGTHFSYRYSLALESDGNNYVNMRHLNICKLSDLVNFSFADMIIVNEGMIMDDYSVLKGFESLKYLNRRTKSTGDKYPFTDEEATKIHEVRPDVLLEYR